MMDIRLYQINRERDEKRRALLSTETLARRGFGPKVIDSNIYDCVFEGTVNCGDLEEVYTLFNVDPPEDFSGHSMSVSDVVVESRTAFFCDSIGFRQVTFDESAARPLRREIHVVLLEPGKLARPAAIDASLESYQKIVGGMIEAFYPFEEPVCIVCNEEGKLDGLPLNRAVYADPSRREMLDIIAGTCFICDCSGEDFGSLSPEQLRRYTEQFKFPQKFFRVGDEIKAVPYLPERNQER